MLHRRLARGLTVCALLAIPVLALPQASATGAVAVSHKADACRNTWLRATVTAAHGQDGLALAETNVSRSFCYMVSPILVQLLTSRGGNVTPAVASPPFTGEGGVFPTYLGTFSLSLNGASRCPHSALVSAIRVTAGAATSLIHVPRVRVCASRPHPLTVSPVIFPHPAPCHGSVIRSTVGWPNGAAGTIYYSIRFGNTGTVACTVHGIPTVQPISTAAAPVGPPSRAEAVTARGGTMVLGVESPLYPSDGALAAPAVTAWATLGVVETGNFSPGACEPATAAGIRVALPGYAATDLTLPISVCTRLVSTSIEGVAPIWLTY